MLFPQSEIMTCSVNRLNWVLFYGGFLKYVYNWLYDLFPEDRKPNLGHIVLTVFFTFVFCSYVAYPLMVLVSFFFFCKYYPYANTLILLYHFWPWMKSQYVSLFNEARQPPSEPRPRRETEVTHGVITPAVEQAGHILKLNQTLERETQTTPRFQLLHQQVPQHSPGMPRQLQPRQDRQPSPGSRPQGIINPRCEQSGDVLQSRQTEGPSTQRSQFSRHQVPEGSSGMPPQFVPRQDRQTPLTRSHGILNPGWQEAGDVFQSRQAKQTEGLSTQPSQFLPHQVPEYPPGMSRQFGPLQDNQPSLDPRQWRAGMIDPGWQQAGDVLQISQAIQPDGSSTHASQFSPRMVSEHPPGPSRRCCPIHPVPDYSSEVSEDSGSDHSSTHLESVSQLSPSESLEDVAETASVVTSVSTNSRSTVGRKKRKPKVVDFHKPKTRRKKPT